MLTWCSNTEKCVAKSVHRPRVRLEAILVALAMVAAVGQAAGWADKPGFARFDGGSAPAENSLAIPVGTILPLRLEETVTIKEAKPGQPLAAKVMQDVPLPSGGKIPMKSTVKGSIVSVVEDADGAGTKVTLKFNQIEIRKETQAILTHLRAMASFDTVRTAQTPLTGADAGAPSGWSNTVQIGGDIRFGDGGPVRDKAKQQVGKGVRGGVLVNIRANPASGCDGLISSEDRPQALWVFSADACGVYDLKGVKIVHKGTSAPVGEITLHFEKDNMKLEAGTALLLRVASQP